MVRRETRSTQETHSGCGHTIVSFQVPIVSAHPHPRVIVTGYRVGYHIAYSSLVYLPTIRSDRLFHGCDAATVVGVAAPS